MPVYSNNSVNKNKIIKGHCPTCRTHQNANIAGEYIHKTVDPEYGVYGIDTYRILQCLGCDTCYFQKSAYFSENDPDDEETITYWPAPSKRNHPEWYDTLVTVDDELGSLFDEVYVALNNDLIVLAAIGIRTIFDYASGLLGVAQQLDFASKLKKLRENGNIGEEEEKVLKVLIDAGSAAAHRGWKPKPTQLHTMLSMLELFLHRNLILKGAAKQLQTGIPGRPKRKKAIKAR